VTEAEPSAGPLQLGTVWVRSRQTPLRQFLRTETGGAAVLLAATIAALIWANADQHSYQACWDTRLSIRLGSAGLDDSLRGWVNSGLMSLFFLVAGLEARREFDMGELRAGHQRRRSVRHRLGHGHVDRHRLRARHAGPGRFGRP
jgi:Na+/H+ antiporter NhaA